VLVSTATHAAKHTKSVRLIGANSPDFSGFGAKIISV
jgi:hypothetical protein